jgi:NhaP-type Na+/H+ or K+/H+ antiporter
MLTWPAHFLLAADPSLGAVASERWLLSGLAGVIVLGIVAQWIAWRVRLPAILLLLGAGIFVGPGWQLITGHKLIDPDALFGDLLPPLVSLSVAIILFEGGLTLNLADLRHVGTALWRLVTLGTFITGIIATIAAVYVLKMNWTLAVLLGAILVVTGPTVIGPLLRYIRPTGGVGALLKWEGIVIDPIGATLALLVFEGIQVYYGGGGSVAAVVAVAILKTVAFGALIGISAAVAIVISLRRFLVADQLQIPLTLAMIVVAFVGANFVQAESGLLAVTVMGVFLANQRFVTVGHILEFKESLTVLLIGTLFILLGSRLQSGQLTQVGWPTFWFVLILVLIARPLSVFVSTAGTGLPRSARLFAAWMAPRGIVAASVSSVFALRLREEGSQGARQLVPVTFAVIVATVTIYGLTAGWLAQRLGLSSAGRRGFLIAGANLLARRIAEALAEAGQEVLLVDTNRENIAAANMAGLATFQGNILSEQLLRRIEGTSIGRLLALTPNAEVNSLAAVHFSRHFGRSQVFQLGIGDQAGGERGERVKADVSRELVGRVLLQHGQPYPQLQQRLAEGYSIKRTQLTREFGYDALAARHGGDLVPIFTIDPTGDVHISTEVDPLSPKAGQSLIALAAPPKPDAAAQPSAAPSIA